MFGGNNQLTWIIGSVIMADCVLNYVADRDSEVVTRVRKDENAIATNHKVVYNSEEFGKGWVEE